MTVRVQNHLTPPNFSASHHFGTWQFGKKHFSMNISSPWHFGRSMFRPCGHTGTWTFCLHGRFNSRTFRHRDILALGIFGTMDVSAQIFQHLNISAHGYFGTLWTYGHFSADIFAPLLLCRNVHVLKCPHAETSMVPKNPCDKKSPCRKVLVNYPNFHGDKMSMCRYVCRAETCGNAGNFKKLHMPPHTIDGSVSKFCQNLHLWSC